MYISWRVSQGAMLYRDVLAPQPPMHLVIGALIAKAGTLLPHPIYAFRIFSLLLHLATMALIYRIAIRLFEKNPENQCMGIVAAGIYMLLPIGFWWTMGYQTQPLVIFFMLLSFYGVIGLRAGSAAGAGVAGALAVLTNMTAAPYVLFNLGWLALRYWWLGLAFLVPLTLVLTSVIVAAETWTGAYLDNVIRNQVGAFPRHELLGPDKTVWSYALGKIQSEGGDVLRLEGSYVALALLGMLVYGWRHIAPIREYALWYTFFSMCCILYVTKGGTVDYVFTLAEPFVALFAGYLLVYLWYQTQAQDRVTRWRLADLSAGAIILIATLLIVCVGYPGLNHSWNTLKQRSYELPENETMRIVDRIRHNSKPDELILSPPHYAFLAQRRIAEDYSELFLWRLKYLNEKLDGEHSRGVQTVERIAALLNQKKIAFLVLDLDQTGRTEEIRKAVDANYEPLLAEPFRTLNTPLQFYRPKP